MTSLYLSNRPNQKNRDLLDFFGENLRTIVKMGIYINFFVAHPDESNDYIRKGVVNFPTLTHQGKTYVGVSKIKDFFMDYFRIYKQKQSQRTEEDDVADYWSGILEKGDEEDPEAEVAEQMKSKAQQEVQNRQTKLNQMKPKSKRPQTAGSGIIKPAQRKGADRSVKSHTSSRPANVDPSAVNVLKSMSSTGESAGDDELMAKFFENRMDMGS